MSLKSKLARLFRYHVKFAMEELARDKRDPHPVYNYERIAYEIAAHEAAQYMVSHLQGARDFVSNYGVLKHSLEACTVEGLMLEFGVFRGGTIKFIAETTKQEVHGFDSWEGLPEDWTHFQKAGRFSTQGNLPDMSGHPNVKLHKGWFDATLPKFLEEQPGPIRFLHVDSDLYSSAVCVLTLLEKRIVRGTVIQFDEYLNFPGWQRHEHKAFAEFCERTGMKYSYLGFASSDQAVSVKIDDDGRG